VADTTVLEAAKRPSVAARKCMAMIYVNDGADGLGLYPRSRIRTAFEIVLCDNLCKGGLCFKMIDLI